jgi:hypothetical protein
MLIKLNLRDNWIQYLLLLFIILFFAVIIFNGIAHHEYKQAFKVKCEESGGEMFVPRGVRGWPAAECRVPRFTIHIPN